MKTRSPVIILILFFCSFFYPCKNIFAQLCGGSLGVPAVFIDFGTSASINSRSQLSPADGGTSYTFCAASTTGPNEYSIAPQSGPSVGFYRLWHDVQDHTPNDQLGNMMILDLNTAGISIYRKIITTGICPNTTYEFSAWMASLLKTQDNGTDPNVTFIIRDNNSNAPLATVMSGPMGETSSISWQKKGAMFTTGPLQPELVLEIICNSSGSAGNDLVIDDISFSPCLPTIIASFVNETNGYFCNGSNVQLKSVLTGTNYRAPVYQWQSGNDNINWTDISGAVSTNYTIPNISANTHEYFRLLAAERGNMNATCRGSSNALQLEVVLPTAVNIPSIVLTCKTDSIIALPITVTAGLANQYSLTSDMPGLLSARKGFLSSAPIPLTLPTGTALGTYHFNIVISDSVYNCNQATANFEVNISEAPEITLTNAAQQLCNGQVLRPIELANTNGNATLTWGRNNNTTVSGLASTGIGTIGGALINNTSALQSVLFTVNAQNGNCVSVATALVDVAPAIQVFAGADTLVTTGVQLTLHGNAPIGLNYSWVPMPLPDFATGMQTLSPTIVVNNDISLVLSASRNGECTVYDTINIKVLKGPEIYVPTGFVPQGVSNKNGFKAIPVGIAEFYYLKVYNRWGQLVFETKDALQAWNGKLNGTDLPAGVYIWMTAGKTDAGNVLQKKGTVTMIR